MELVDGIIWRNAEVTHTWVCGQGCVYFRNQLISPQPLAHEPHVCTWELMPTFLTELTPFRIRGCHRFYKITNTSAKQAAPCTAGLNMTLRTNPRSSSILERASPTFLLRLCLSEFGTSVPTFHLLVLPKQLWCPVWAHEPPRQSLQVPANPHNPWIPCLGPCLLTETHL